MLSSRAFARLLRWMPVLAAVLGLAPSGLWAQETLPTTAPVVGGSPTSQATSRPRLVIPPGFVRVDVGGRRFLIEPADEAWIREAVAATGPATRPTTLPADLLTRLKDRRGELIQALRTDLLLTEEQAAKLPDERLRPELERIEAYTSKNVLLVATRERLTEVAKAGWENPAIYYNRATGEVRASTGIVLVDDPDDAQSLILLADDGKAEPEKRRQNLAQALQFIDTQLLDNKAQSGMYAVQVALTKFIVEEGLNRLDLKLDQAWFSNGVTGILATKYLCLISGLPERAIMDTIINEPRGVPIRMSSLDLLNPPDAGSIRREAIPYFLDALRRKSVRAIDELILRHGQEIIPALITEIGEKKPADGPALVALIKARTGTDLTPFLRTGQAP